MKLCCRCKLLKLEADYNKNKSRYDGLQSSCRLCDRLESSTRYHSSAVVKASCRKRNHKLHNDNRSKLCEWLSSRPCINCGETDITVLEFDHNDPTSKRACVSRLLRDRNSWATILTEIQKCTVRCSNCHSKKTAKERNDYRHRWMLTTTKDNPATIAEKDYTVSKLSRCVETCKRKSCTELIRIATYRGPKPEYCSKRCKNIDHVDRYRKRQKQKLVDMKGGKCVMCGYNKSLAALEFHHLDPTKKDFAITTSITLSSAKVLEELEKCILVCANCHREIHYGTQES